MILEMNMDVRNGSSNLVKLEEAIKSGGKYQVDIVAKTLGASDAHTRVPERLYSRTEDGKNFVKRRVSGILGGVESIGENTIISVNTSSEIGNAKITSYVLVGDILELSLEKI